MSDKTSTTSTTGAMSTGATEATDSAEVAAPKICMNQEQTDALMAQLITELRELQIPLPEDIIPRVRINTRARRRLGCCYKLEEGFLIELSYTVLNDRRLATTTMVHELLHTCPGCQNHQQDWKAHAAKVSQAMGLDIQRTIFVEGENPVLRHEEVKYLLVCQSCGKVIRRKRMSKAVKHPSKYRCPCGGKLKRVLLTSSQG